MTKINGSNPVRKIADTLHKTIKKDISKKPSQLPLAENFGKTKLGELKNAGNVVKAALNSKFDAGKKSVGIPPTPGEALKQIEELPKPNREGIPEFLPKFVKDGIYQNRVKTYNEQKSAIADNAINNAQPPKREDFKGLNPATSEMEYQAALSNHNKQIGELKDISLEAKKENLQNDANFKKLPVETQNLAKELLVRNKDNPREVDTLAKLLKTEGFNKLKPEEQTKFLNYVGGTNVEISQPARHALETLLNDPAVDKTNPGMFRQFLKEQPGLPFVVSASTVPGQFDANRKPYTVDGPEEVAAHDFHSGSSAALKYTVEIDGKKIPVYMPKNPVAGENYHSIDEVAKGLASLPEVSLGKVNSVSVDPNQNPDDAYWAKEYNQPGFRSYMTAGADGNISIYPSSGSTPQQNVLDSSLIHETGHTLSKQLMGETSDKLRGIKDFIGDLFGKTTWADWKSAMKKDGVSASQYAKSSPDEDFAETLTLYMMVKGTPQEAELREIMPERFALMDSILSEQK